MIHNAYTDGRFKTCRFVFCLNMDMTVQFRAVCSEFTLNLQTPFPIWITLKDREKLFIDQS